MLSDDQIERLKTCMKYDRCRKCPHNERICLTAYSYSEIQGLILEYLAENESLKAKETAYLETIDILSEEIETFKAELSLWKRGHRGSDE